MEARAVEASEGSRGKGDGEGGGEGVGVGGGEGSRHTTQQQPAAMHTLHAHNPATHGC